MAVRASRAALSVTSPCRRWTITLLLLWFASTSAVDNAAERSIDGAPDMALIHQRPPSQMTGNVEENIATDELPSTVTVIETSTPRVVFIEKIGYEDEGGSKDGSPDVEKHLKKVLNVQQEDFFEISSRNLTEVLPVIERITSEVCRNETRMLFQELARSTPWAVQMFDSSTKTPEGIVIGSTFNFGNFDECVGVRGPPRAEGEPEIQGQYCLMEVIMADPRVKPPERGYMEYHYILNYKLDGHKYLSSRIGSSNHYLLHWAVCIPSGCNSHDLKEFLVDNFYGLGQELQVHVNVRDDMCHYDKKVTFDKWDIIFMSIMAVYLTIVIVGTTFSLLVKRRSPNTSVFEDLLLAFSVSENLGKLSSHTPSELGMDCVFGFKFYAMFMILGGHSLLFLIGGPVLNETGVNKVVRSIANEPFKNNQVFVDTFFLVSGFLLSRLLLVELDKKKRVNLFSFFALRYIRLTPAYAVVIAFYATLFPKIGSGPLWDARIGLERDRCVESWWANIIYVNNYVNTDMLCMFQSWYIAADTQLFLISMFLVYTIWRWPTVGKILLFVVLALSLAIPFVITLISRLDPLLMMFRAELEDISSNAFFKHSYVKTHMRGTPYFLGVLLGYLVHRLQQSNKKVPKIAVWFGWIFSTFLLISSLYSSNVFYDPNYRYYASDAAVFASLDKLGWSLGSSWIIFACVTKNAGPIEMFLTWKPIIPLSRLTYSAFLVNGVVVLHHLGTLRAPTYVEDISLIKILISHVVVTFLLALVLSITFESPLNAIQKILLRKGRRKGVSKENEERT